MVCLKFFRLLLSNFLGLLGLGNPFPQGSSCRCYGLLADRGFTFRYIGLRLRDLGGGFDAYFVDLGIAF